MGIVADEFTGKLVTGKEIKSHLRVRASSFVTATVDKRLLSDYKDWEIVKENIKKVSLRKPKTHFDMFEDRLWAIFARMDFTILNKQGLRCQSAFNFDPPSASNFDPPQLVSFCQNFLS